MPLDGGTIARATPEPGTHRVVVAPDGEHFVDTFSDRKTPPVTTIRDREGKILATLDDAATDPRVEQMALAPPLLTEFKNRDGVTLHGAYYPPAIDPGRRECPLVVMVYGGPHVQNRLRILGHDGRPDGPVPRERGIRRVEAR